MGGKRLTFLASHWIIIDVRSFCLISNPAFIDFAAYLWHLLGCHCVLLQDPDLFLSMFQSVRALTESRWYLPEFHRTAFEQLQIRFFGHHIWRSQRNNCRMRHPIIFKFENESSKHRKKCKERAHGQTRNTHNVQKRQRFDFLGVGNLTQAWTFFAEVFCPHDAAKQSRQPDALEQGGESPQQFQRQGR